MKSYETVQLPAIDMDDVTEKRQAVQASFLSRLIRKEQDELAGSQARIEKMLQAWGTPSEVRQ